VLGLVGSDLLLDLIDAVVTEDAQRAFALADRAVESGTDLKLVCRELSQVVRDMMVISIDPARVSEGVLGADAHERLTALAGQFSREDLMRAFDLLSTAEQEIRLSSQPRYYFEMILLRWMHLRKLVPLTDLIEQLGGAGPGTRNPAPTSNKVAPASGKLAPASNAIAPTSSKVAPTSNPIAPTSDRIAPTSSKVAPTSNPIAPTSNMIAPTSDKVAPASSKLAPTSNPIALTSGAIAPTSNTIAPTSNTIAPASSKLKDSLLAEIRAGKGFFYNTVVAQAQKIDVDGDRVTFTFLPAHRALREQFDQSRAWLEAAAERLTGRKISVTAVQSAGDAPAPEPEQKSSAPAPAKRDLKAEALSSTGVQALLDVFPAEIRDVEEM
jgi:DNA polymerase III gamma/tau subunit